ncbi:MAG TPA: hypothetical protein VK610_03725 [Rhodothermales bacterium]|nr:hypothetical protein [Rhodothermales bacterium]
MPRLLSIALLLILVPLSAGRLRAQDCHVAPPPVLSIGGTQATPEVPRYAAGDTIRLSVAVLYTPEAADSAAGRGSTIGAYIDGAFAAWQPVLDSAATPGPRILAVPSAPFEIDLDETGACFPDLDSLYAHPRARFLRDSLRANVVVLFTARCSAAYQCSPAADCEAAAYTSARFATAGPTTPEGGFAMAHEVGHALGMRHDTGDDPTPGFNHGLRDDTGGFFTLLAFRGALPRTAQVPYYADPRRTFNGRPLGVEGVADNARQLREIAAVASTWNDDGTPVEPPPVSSLLGLTAAPNPSRAGWTVQVDAPAAGTLHFTLIDVMGRQVWAGAHAVPIGPSRLPVPGAGLAPGVYALGATWDGGGNAYRARLVLTRTR